MSAFGKKEKEKAVDVFSNQDFNDYHDVVDEIVLYLEEIDINKIEYNVDFIASEAFDTDGSTYFISVDSDELFEIIEASKECAHAEESIVDIVDSM